MVNVLSHYVRDNNEQSTGTKEFLLSMKGPVLSLFSIYLFHVSRSAKLNEKM